jgi:hypothetical protein
VRVVVLVVAVASLLSAPLAAAELHPRVLVLQSADVPAGFEVELVHTEIRTNRQEAKDDRRGPRSFERWGRVTGYQAAFVRGTAKIDSRADLLRTAPGAEMMLDFFAREVANSGIKGLVRSRLRVGNDGWIYGGAHRLPSRSSLGGTAVSSPAWWEWGSRERRRSLSRAHSSDG